MVAVKSGSLSHSLGSETPSWLRWTGAPPKTLPAKGLHLLSGGCDPLNLIITSLLT